MKKVNKLGLQVIGLIIGVIIILFGIVFSAIKQKYTEFGVFVIFGIIIFVLTCKTIDKWVELWGK